MSYVIMAIREVLPEFRIKLFTLASTDREAYINAGIKLNGYPYSWKPKEGWLVVEEPVSYYSELEKLKGQILNDSFN